MAFDSYGAERSGGGNKPTVDFDALNNYVINTVDCEQPETMNGVITGIVDLGTQKQPDAEYDVDDEDKDLSIDELNAKHASQFVQNFEGDEQYGKIVKFAMVRDNKTKKDVLKKIVKQKPRQSIIYCVDFPDIMLNKGQFFGDNSGKESPLRLWVGGSFYQKHLGKMTVQNVIPLKIIKDDKLGWTLNPASTLHKLAVGTRVVSTDQAFEAKEIDKLLGKTAQFQIQVFNQPSTKDNRQFYTEKIKFVGAIQKKDKPFEDVETFLIQFNHPNDETALKQVRKHVINTITQATNFEGSAIQKQLIELKIIDGSVNTTSADAPVTNDSESVASDDEDF